MPKKSTESREKTENESREFGHLYGTILINAARTSFHDDSGCFDDLCQPYTETVGAWKYVYQPTKAMKEMEDLVVAIIITRADRKKITRTMFENALVYVEKVQDLYISSYRDIVTFTNGRWTEQVDGSFEQVAKIRQPLTLDAKSGIIKMKYEVRGEGYRCDDWWYPARLYHWLGKQMTDSPFDEHGRMIGSIDTETGLPEEYYYMKTKLSLNNNLNDHDDDDDDSENERKE